MRFPAAARIKNRWASLTQHGIILMYHRISDISPGSDPWGLCVSPSHFEEHLKILKSLTRPIKLRELTKSLNDRRFGRRRVIVTFDDGYADNAAVAKPLLEKYEIPATFFIISGAVDRQKEFWWDELERIILLPSRLPQAFEVTIANSTYSWKITPEAGQGSFSYSAVTQLPEMGVFVSRHQLYLSLWKILSDLSPLEKEEALNRIAQWAGQAAVPRRTHLPLTSKELLSLAACRLCEVGAHTVTHPRLSSLPQAEQEKEIAQSKRSLEEMIDQTIFSFSYPHGDQSEQTLKLVERAKFQQACVVLAKAVRRKTNPFLLPRFTVFNWGGEEFERNIRQWSGC